MGPFWVKPTKPAVRVSAIRNSEDMVSEIAAYTPGGRISADSRMNRLVRQGQILNGRPCLLLRTGMQSAAACFVDLFIDTGNLSKPYVPLLMFHVEDIVKRPMKVVCNISDLLMELLFGIRGDCPPLHPWPGGLAPPSSLSIPRVCPVTMSTSNL